MPILISITNYPSMPWRYRWSAIVGKKRYFGDVVNGGPEHAAAVAIDKAARYASADGYTIFAPKEVMKLIPEDMRSVRGAR